MCFKILQIAESLSDMLVSSKKTRLMSCLAFSQSYFVFFVSFLENFFKERI